MDLGYLTEEAYEDLWDDKEKNREKYYGEDPWLDDYFSGRKYYGISSDMPVSPFSLFSDQNEQDNSDKCEEDLANVRILYEALKGLTPLQACNKYMWTYLCHADESCRKYIQNRWLFSAPSGKDPDGIVRAHFFVTDQAQSLYRDNALARLWWYGYLTYDENESDPYALTRILLTQEAVATDVMGTMNRMNFERMKGLLFAIREFVEEDLQGNISNLDEDYVRPCNRYLNRYAAVTNLDYLDHEEIRKIAYEQLVKLKEQKDQAL